MENDDDVRRAAGEEQTVKVKVKNDEQISSPLACFPEISLHSVNISLVSLVHTGTLSLDDDDAEVVLRLVRWQW